MPDSYEVPVAQALLTFCYENFRCQHGPPKAFFEIPQDKFVDPVRIYYVVYAIEGPTYESCEAWMIDNVLMPLKKKAGEPAWLYWRLQEMIEVQVLRDAVRVRTRIGVVDRHVEAVVLEDVVKPEGAPIEQITT